MRCPKCGYVSFDYLDECQKCGKDISHLKEDKKIYASPVQKIGVWEFYQKEKEGGESREENTAGEKSSPGFPSFPGEDSPAPEEKLFDTLGFDFNQKK